MNKLYSALLAVLVVVCAASCSNQDKRLQGMIPATATGVMSVDVPRIVELAGGAANDDQYSVPAAIKELGEAENASPLAQMLANLPNSGVSSGARTYTFFTRDEFRWVLLLPLADASIATKSIGRMLGHGLREVSGLQYARQDQLSYAVAGDVMLIARENRPATDEALAQALAAIAAGKAKSMLDVADMKESINADGDITAWFDVPGLNQLLSTVPAVKQLVERVPLLSIITDSDVESFNLLAKFEQSGASLTMNVKAGENSDFVRLLDKVKAQPSADFLKVIPTTMRCVTAVSVNGEALMQLEQVKRSVNLLSNLPRLDKLGLRDIVNGIDGPLAIGFAPSFMMGDEGESSFADDWNITVAARSKQPQQVVDAIKAFAAEMGQPDYEKDGRHVYNWGGKPVYVGAVGDIVYATRLDHELLEDMYWDYPDVRDRFASNPVGFYLQTDVRDAQGAVATRAFFNIGFKDYSQATGLFYTANDTDNSALVLLQLLCSVSSTPPNEADYVDEWDD